MTTIWRLQTNTASVDGKKIGNYCLEKKIIALGWSLREESLMHLSEQDRKNAINERKQIQTFEDYQKLNSKYLIYDDGKTNSNLLTLSQNIEVNDLVWLRQDGIYYLGRITHDSKWRYDSSQEALQFDASNQFTNIEWHKIGDESDVPGTITTAFIRGRTIQRIRKKGMSEYSQLLYNEKSNNELYKNVSLTHDTETFFNLLSTEDCEDLLCMWLFKEFGYIVIPSTNKKSTELYECVLRDPKTGKNIYIQVKSGEVDISGADYKDLPGNVWLLTTKGKVTEDNYSNIKIADPKVLFDFINQPDSKNLLPKSIFAWNYFLSKKATTKATTVSSD